MTAVALIRLSPTSTTLQSMRMLWVPVSMMGFLSSSSSSNHVIGTNPKEMDRMHGEIVSAVFSQHSQWPNVLHHGMAEGSHGYIYIYVVAVCIRKGLNNMRWLKLYLHEHNCQPKPDVLSQRHQTTEQVIFRSKESSSVESSDINDFVPIIFRNCMYITSPVCCDLVLFCVLTAASIDVRKCCTFALWIGNLLNERKTLHKINYAALLPSSLIILNINTISNNQGLAFHTIVIRLISIDRQSFW